MSSIGYERQEKLRRFFLAALRDSAKISSVKNAELFLEAIYTAADVAETVALILAHPKGRQILNLATRQDTSPDFISAHSSKLLRCFAAPELATINQGQVKEQVYLALIRPSFFFDACLDALKRRLLKAEEATLHVAGFVSNVLSIMSTDEFVLHSPTLTDSVLLDALDSDEIPDVRAHGFAIRSKVERMAQGDQAPEITDGPGWRHDNDHAAIGKIAILPTHDEIVSSHPAFVRTAREVFTADFACRDDVAYREHLFRTYREDLVHTFRESLNSSASSRQKPLVLAPAAVHATDTNDVHEAKPWAWRPWAVRFKTFKPLPGTESMTTKERFRFLDDSSGRGSRILRAGSLMAIRTNGFIIGFGTVKRDALQLAGPQPVLSLYLDQCSVGPLLKYAGNKSELELVQVDSPVFAYEPFLKHVQQMSKIDFLDLLLCQPNASFGPESTGALQLIMQSAKANDNGKLQQFFGKKLDLDSSQCAALHAGLSRSIAIIQGPPGTGKSFIGSLIAKTLHDNLAGPILVICFTNHALDQFTEDMMDMGISENSIIRLGSKSSPRTAPLLLRSQQQQKRPSAAQWGMINERKPDLARLATLLSEKLRKIRAPPSPTEILEFLEFHDDDTFWTGMSVPENLDGMKVVGKKGRNIGPNYLLNRWQKGASDAGAFSQHPDIGSSSIWALSADRRQALYSEWIAQIRADDVRDFCKFGLEYDSGVAITRDVFRALNAELLGEKRIIACTSTQAAMSSDILSKVKPESVLIEEAGELLEIQALAALGNCTKRLIMIGDEKQLRPKISSYALSVESGKGFDLNRSLFERLILDGYPHVSLSKQHRMRPEVSELVRHLTYPELQDAEGTLNRANIRGLQRNVVFFSHHEFEQSRTDVLEKSSGSSKQNPYEAQVILKIVKYLAQNGYKSDDMVVLTPYMAQLRHLQDTLSKENDPVLNDLDSQDLYQAGLLHATAAKGSGRRVHLSSIDNYQGNEKKIVIVSLTRSNDRGRIGFMAEPERLNVLLSRARDGMILVGNLDTFTASPKGGEIWRKLWSYANVRGYIWPGLPVQCETHPNVKPVVTTPADFDKLCPDGGCIQPCLALLPCGMHQCPSRCHPNKDHSRSTCNELVKSKCDKGHAHSRKCAATALTECPTCLKEDRRRKDLARRLLDQAEQAERSQQQHERQVDALDHELKSVQEQIASIHADKERQQALREKETDLQRLRLQLQRAQKKAAHEKANPAQTETIQAASFDQSASEGGNKANKQVVPGLATLISTAQDEWERQKRVDGQSNEAIDKLMALVGLENIKQHILDLSGQIATKQRQGIDLSGERPHVSFLGNPGTGKTTVARLWSQLLYSLGVTEGEAFEETTGSKLATNGVPAAQKHLDRIEKASGGVFFVDEAYQLTSGANANGRAVLDFLLTEIENRRSRIIFVFAGYLAPMEDFYSHNLGIPSRIRTKFIFHDYTEAELLFMLQSLFRKRFKGEGCEAKIEGGVGGLYMRIVARRLSRLRDKEGFGNMRDLENLFHVICRRQSRRISDSRKQGVIPDDFEFLAEDLIGPEPSSAIQNSPAWAKLQGLIGLKAVKDSVKTLVELLKTNFAREIQEKKPLDVSLNKVFTGSPGTGKTTVAQLYGRILADIGMLSAGDVVTKTPADFIGSAIGQSEENARKILESAKGKVLIIDEAYMLDSSSGNDGAGVSDPYRTAVIDTIVSQVHNTPGDDRCVLLLGYEEQMSQMFQRVNPGLSRRFPLEDAFRFDDFNEQELQQILRLKLSTQDLDATREGERVAMEVLKRARDLMNFGNAGEVENIITRAKMNRQRRQTNGAGDGDFILDAVDFDPDFDRAKSAADRIDVLFKDHVGFELLVEQLKQYQRIAANAKLAGQRVEDHVPFTYVFRGPPGTGKTTTARKIGQVYYDMGLLQRVEVVEASVSDLVGQYEGQTGPKTEKQLSKALGGILFVDEAYRLSEGHFATEAVNELTDLLTKPKFKGKLIVILAGYEDEMERLMAVNPGLSSRFPETIDFKPLTATQCLQLFQSQLRQNGLACASLDVESSPATTAALAAFKRLTELKHWGNGRDVQNLAKKAMRFAYGRDISPGEDGTLIPDSVILSTLHDEHTARLKTERHARAPQMSPSLPLDLRSMPNLDRLSGPSLTTQAVRTMKTEQMETNAEDTEDSDSGDDTSGRDPGVSDATWAGLQKDIAANEKRAQRDNEVLAELRTQEQNAQRELRRMEDRLAQLGHDGHSSDSDGDGDSEDDSEESEHRKLMKEIALARAEKRKQEEERRREEERQEAERQKELAAQKKLAAMGVCPQGFPWIRQGDSGYRCAGGSHFISGAQLGGL